MSEMILSDQGINGDEIMAMPKCNLVQVRKVKGFRKETATFFG